MLRKDSRTRIQCYINTFNAVGGEILKRLYLQNCKLSDILSILSCWNCQSKKKENIWVFNLKRLVGREAKWGRVYTEYETESCPLYMTFDVFLRFY